MGTRITNFGSCCIDNVYSVPAFVRPGETLPCTGYEVHPGGKGLNQSIALAYAGAHVRHVGRVGTEGAWLKTLLADSGVDVSLLGTHSSPSGHAVIQVTPEGENAIVIFGGANRLIDSSDLGAMLDDAQPGEFLLLQNEISYLPEIIAAAAGRGMRVVFNAAPMTSAVLDYPLDKVECFIINEVEGAAISGAEDAAKVVGAMAAKFPNARTVLTLGSEGAIYHDPSSGQLIKQAAVPVQAMDTTGAGDTFTGYFLAGYAAGIDIERCLRRACVAAGLCVTRAGAASSIPRGQEVDQAEQASSSRRL